MLSTRWRAVVATAGLALLVSPTLAQPSAAAEAVRVAGSGQVVDEQCAVGPYEDDVAPAGVLPLLFSGDLVGCYYTDTSDPRVTAAGGGRYRLVDRGTETFIGELNGTPVSFRTSFVVLAWFDGNPLEDPDAALLKGSCHHPLIEGGTGALHFVDDPDTGIISYRGVVNLP